MGLDLIGQTQLWLKLAGEAEGKGRSADDLAFLRTERQFTDCLLVEQPNTDFAHALMRQYCSMPGICRCSTGWRSRRTSG